MQVSKPALLYVGAAPHDLLVEALEAGDVDAYAVLQLPNSEAIAFAYSEQLQAGL